MARKPHPLTPDAITEAIRRLGGEAKVKEIKQIIFEVDPKLRRSYPDGIKHADIQARLQSHSSSPKFSSVEAGSDRDLFERIGEKYKSSWRVRADQREQKDQANAGSIGLSDDEGFNAIEGTPEFKIHLRRERNAKLIERFKGQLGKLSCIACDFEFKKYYGKVGENFIEAHHINPISSRNGGTKTSLSDLIPLCANCHRMIHRCQPMTLETLRSAIASSRAKAASQVVTMASEARNPARRPRRRVKA